MTESDQNERGPGEGEPAEVPVEVETTPLPVDPTAELQEKIATLEKEKKELHDRFLRGAADLENFRRRSRKDVDDARTRSREEVLKEILPSIDNLERAVLAALEPTATVAVLVEGVKLVLRQFLSGLERFEIKPFPAQGEPFDPARHEAVSQVETAEHPPGTVVSEMQRGYMIGGRLLRPAMVAVAKAPPAPPPEEKAE
jgi:molecular chaperone GrpE